MKTSHQKGIRELEDTMKKSDIKLKGPWNYIFSENIFWKRKYFQVFDCILKNTLENIIRCLVVFLKMF